MHLAAFGLCDAALFCYFDTRTNSVKMSIIKRTFDRLPERHCAGGCRHSSPPRHPTGVTNWL